MQDAMKYLVPKDTPHMKTRALPSVFVHCGVVGMTWHCLFDFCEVRIYSGKGCAVDDDLASMWDITQCFEPLLQGAMVFTSFAGCVDLHMAQACSGVTDTACLAA